jgi:hypothetical protein
VRRARAGARLAAVGLACAAAAALACSDDVTVGPNGVFSLFVDTIPAPSVVAGDTLRDTLGHVLRISAVAYNLNGAVLPNVPIRFYSLDTTQLRFDTLGHAIGVPTGDGTPEFVVDAEGLQSLPQTLPVVLPPTLAAHADSDSATTIVLSLTSPASNISVPLVVNLQHFPDTVGADSVTRSYWMSYHIVYPAFAVGATGAPSDTAFPIYVTDPNVNPAPLDTTDVNGNGTRYVYFNAAKLAALNDLTDSVVVQATSFYHGAPVSGCPVRFVIHYSE